MRFARCFTMVVLIMCCCLGQAAAMEPELSDTQVMEWLRTHLPRAEEEMQRLKTDDPGIYAEEMQMLGDQILYIEEVKKENPELAARLIEAEDLEFRSWTLAEQMTKIKDPGQRQALEEELRSVLGKVFDIRQAERSQEIEALEKEVRKLRKTVEKRKGLRDAIIEKRMSEMTQTVDEDMAWW
ncbi:MAG: hypothetical protein MI802_05800 [Desulfobacterales bacterium]|nr:hypothetical protein [Desulfobacterales bacterium]